MAGEGSRLLAAMTATEAGRAIGHGNPDIAELGRKYWLAHIPWGSPGATKECHEQVMLHAHFTDQQAWGYCAERHHEATGRWPGQKKGGKGRRDLAPAQMRGAVQMGGPDVADQYPGTVDLPDDWGDMGGLPDLTGLTLAEIEACAAEAAAGMGG